MDVLAGLPTHDDHVGGRIAVGPDRKLYLTIGDGGANFGGNRCMVNHAQTLPTAAQVSAKNWAAYQGKILRIDLDGGIPADNPTVGGVRSHVFSVGHRNPLGLAFGPGGRLYESEHGPSSDDEVNLIESGRNYGWPNVAGHKDDKAYTYANWSASAPQACASLPAGNANAAIPASVPQQTESSFTNPLFTPPLQTFFTVDNGWDFRQGATMAPGGVEVYTGKAIPGWANSVLALSLLRGVAFKMTLAADGKLHRRAAARGAEDHQPLPRPGGAPRRHAHLHRHRRVRPHRRRHRRPDDQRREPGQHPRVHVRRDVARQLLVVGSSSSALRSLRSTGAYEQRRLHDRARREHRSLRDDDNAAPDAVAVAIRVLHAGVVHQPHAVADARVLVDDRAAQHDVAADAQARRAGRRRRLHTSPRRAPPSAPPGCRRRPATAGR